MTSERRLTEEHEPSDPGASPIFEPFTLRGLTLKNRLALAAMSQYSARDGIPGDWHLVHLGSRAVGGLGLIVTEMVAPMPDGRVTAFCTGMYKAAHVRRWRRIVDFVHDSGAKICLQLGHAGRKGATRQPWRAGDRSIETGRWPLYSASALPYYPDSPTPIELSGCAMERVRDAFVAAARMADRAGFDMLELHMAHGFLLASFISPLTNRRSDRYGGDISRRAAYPLEVFHAVRAAFPDHKPVVVRISASDWHPGGLSVEDVLAFAHLLQAAGCDLIDVSTGQTTPHAAAPAGPMYQVPFSELIRRCVSVPTMVAGAITSPEQATHILLEGRADLIALGRVCLWDPYFALRSAMSDGNCQVDDWPVQYRAGRELGRTLSREVYRK